MLEKSEEIKLIKSAQEGSDAAKTSLYLAYENYIIKTARKYASVQVPLEDLIQHATLGFLEAINKYDTSLEPQASMATFARTRMMSHIFSALNTMQRDFRLYTTHDMKKIFSNIAKYRDGRRYLSQKQIQLMACELGVKESDIIEIEKRLSSERIGLNDEVSEDGMMFSEKLSDEASSPEDIVLSACHEGTVSESLHVALSGLSDKECDIVSRRFLPVDGKKVTYKTIAEELGVKTQRVEQIQKGAFSKMKNKLQHLHH